jgi:small multidrug resistance pump
MMSNWIYLAVAICAEVIATSALKASEGFAKFWPSVLVVIGYAVAFYCLSLTLRTIPVGTAYAVWSGLGVALIVFIGWFLFDQRIDIAGMIGMALIVLGVLVINLFSKSAAH